MNFAVFQGLNHSFIGRKKNIFFDLQQIHDGRLRVVIALLSDATRFFDDKDGALEFQIRFGKFLRHKMKRNQKRDFRSLRGKSHEVAGETAEFSFEKSLQEMNV